MGNPTHFSLEVPKRAHQLLCDMYERLSESEGTKLPLKATFLLSVSMPIIILPIERILNYKRNATNGPVNDAVLNPALANALDNALDLEAEVHKAPFFKGPWEYAALEKEIEFPNLASDGLPDKIAEKLDSPSALEDAKNLPANRFCKILRNSLAHGGILYLDENGRSYQGAPVQRFAFVSTNDPKNPTKLHFLRIGMFEFRQFLQSWTEWLNEESMERLMSEDVGLEPQEDELAIILDDTSLAVST